MIVALEVDGWYIWTIQLAGCHLVSQWKSSPENAFSSDSQRIWTLSPECRSL